MTKSSLYGEDYGKPIVVDGNHNQASRPVGSEIAPSNNGIDQAQYDLNSYFNGPRKDGETLNWAGGTLTYHAGTVNPVDPTEGAFAVYANSDGTMARFGASSTIAEIARSNFHIAKQWNAQYGLGFDTGDLV